MSKETGTVEELDLKAGDVVELVWNNILSQKAPPEVYVCGEDGVLRDVNTGNMGGRGAWNEPDVHGHIWRIISRASDDTPKLWCDMTHEEKSSVPDEVLNDPTNPLQIPWGEWTREAKGAVLLAEHEGKVIEVNTGRGWHAITPVFTDDVAYRVKPEPVRETVGLYAGLDRKRHPLPIGTIVLEDGKPDRDSINMEEI